ncbi:MAG: HAD hydrolase-like protein [Anaerolineae bacterium]|nr:HAD hydrolase-like protein [Anaerolineae bacterium]
MTPYKLIIFDLDGTLVVDRESSELLPGVLDWFTEHHAQQRIAIATNQGGVGLRYWMEVEKFGRPQKYPTEDRIWSRVDAVQAQLPGGPYPANACFAYQNRKGIWSPTPPDKRGQPEWSPDCRKPAPGMLRRAMTEAEIANPADCLMVGDRVEDQLAAQAAGCAFQWAWEFFGREKPDEAP